MCSLVALVGTALATVGAPSGEITTHLFVDADTPELAAADGSAALPFATVHGAQQALRAGVGRGTERIVHVKGTHHLDRPLALTDADSGTPEAPIRWLGFGSSAAMSGGKPIPATAFSPVSGHPTMVKADLYSLGFNASTLGKLACPHPASIAQLYLNGIPQTIARTPNIAANKTWMWYGYEKLTDVNDSFFILNDEAAVTALQPALTGSEGLWLHGYWKFDWRETYIKIDSITKETNGWKFTRDAATAPQYPFTKGCRFYALGALSMLDVPGEYHIDRTDGSLYFIPPTPLGPGDSVVVSFLESVVQNSGADHVSFEAMTVSDARDAVLSISGCQNGTVADCTVSNAGSSCLSASGTGLLISNNTIFGCGTAGVSINSGDISSLTSGDSRVIGNRITDVSQIVRTYTPGVAFQGVGLYVANNTVTSTPHTAMTGGGNNHLFEYNTIQHACYECTDVGAFYTGRSWSQRGNVVRYNLFDGVFATERLAQKSCSQNAFYLDDEMSGYQFYNNTIRNAAVGILLGGGRDNTIMNNYFENNQNDIHFDDRGMTWQRNYCNYNCTSSQGYQPACFRLELEKLNYTNPPYSTAYPDLPKIFQDHPCLPVHNVISGNKYCHDKVSGKFLDATPEQITSWLSSATDNTAACQ